MLAQDGGDSLYALDALSALLAAGDVCVLTGAGCSTESGIPDYRGPETRRRARNPIRMDAFLRDPETRRRYWARSYVGWPRMQAAVPNAAHLALAQLARAGLVSGLITQNVDGLHGRAGTPQVVELHGALREARCLDCGARTPRAGLQARLARDNPLFLAARQSMAPDGDADIADALVESFVPPACDACGEGVLKPDVVFFGEGVPRERVAQASGWVARSRALLVVGSSLAVYSGLRFVRQAHAEGTPVALVNLGESRGDALSRVRVAGKAGEVLGAVAARVLGSSAGGPP